MRKGGMFVVRNKSIASRFSDIQEKIFHLTEPSAYYAIQDPRIWNRVSTLLKDVISTLFLDLSQTEYETALIQELRSLYIPLLIIQLHNIYLDSRSESSSFLKDELELTNIVASESTKFYLLFQNCDRPSKTHSRQKEGIWDLPQKLTARSWSHDLPENPICHCQWSILFQFLQFVVGGISDGVNSPNEKQLTPWNHPERWRTASYHGTKMSKIQMDDSVEDFFERIRELDRERIKERQSKKQLPGSESINDFNSSSSEQYHLNVDGLVYESAYNYDKSRNKEKDSSAFRERAQSYKKYEDIDIVRFDDFLTKNPVQCSAATSRYAKFELSDEEKRKIDDVIFSLIGESPEEETPPKLPARRTTHSVGVEESKTQKSRSSSPIKRSPAKIDIHLGDDDAATPHMPPKRLEFADNRADLITSKKSSKPEVKPKGKWINDALKHSSSTLSQGATNTNFSDDHSHSWSMNKWLSSAVTNSPSTPKGKNTSFKVSVDHSNGPISWLESAKKTNSTTAHAPQRTKIAPIVPSKSNTLTAILKEDELSKSQSEKTLKELNSPILNHVERSPSRLKSQLQTKELSPIVLKKIRPPAPRKPKELSKSLEKSPEGYLKSDIAIKKPSIDAPEVMKVSKSLRPAVPVRKASIKIPEALAKKGTLKNAKPLPEKTEVVLEAIEKKKFLKEVNLLPAKEDAVPEAVQKSQRLKPVKPMRKPSVKQLEALQALNNLKKSDILGIKAKSRVLSNSKEVLSNQRKSLTSINNTDPKKTNEDPRKAILERVLQRAQTTPISLSSARDDALTPIKKASTFDSSQLQKDVELTHLTKTRSKGPKRRAPKIM